MLYKYMAFAKFIEVIELERLYLTNITLWDDPFEGFSLDSITANKIPLVIFNIAPDMIRQAVKGAKRFIYAQSWTSDKEESDAMWRIYSQDKFGVRISVDFEQILAAVKQSISGTTVNHYKVRYSQSGKRYMDDITGQIMTDKDACEIKRPAFKHEEEYRISCSLDIAQIYPGQKFETLEALANVETPPIIPYNISLSVLKEIILDPRAPKCHEDTFTKYCEARSFKQKGIAFKKSDLYSYQA